MVCSGRCVHPCAQAGLRHWIRFIEITHGVENVDTVAFPPDLQDVLAWSNTFRPVGSCSVGRCFKHLSCGRCFGTFSNYLGHVRGACHALGFEAPPVGHGAIKRAMIAIVKRELTTPRPRHFIDRCLCSFRLLDGPVQCACQDLRHQHGPGCPTWT